MHINFGRQDPYSTVRVDRHFAAGISVLIVDFNGGREYTYSCGKQEMQKQLHPHPAIITGSSWNGSDTNPLASTLSCHPNKSPAALARYQTEIVAGPVRNVPTNATHELQGVGMADVG